MNPILYDQNNFQIKIDNTPVGGYRGDAGALILEHSEKKLFTEWNSTDLNIAAALIQRILFIHEQSGINNTLIIGRQDFEAKDSPYGSFKLKFIPYPKCNWIEKIQGFIHIIFGLPKLKQKELEKINNFYAGKFDFFNTFEIKEFEGNRASKGEDLFCNEAILNNQKITSIEIKKFDYDLLYDNRPKGASPQDPHLLIIPKGESGHADGSKVPCIQRQNVLAIAQQAMTILSNGHNTVFFIERNGEKLRSVQHKSTHLIGLKEFPNTFLKKIWAFARQFFAFRCPNLNDITEKLRKFEWTPPNN